MTQEMKLFTFTTMYKVVYIIYLFFMKRFPSPQKQSMIFNTVKHLKFENGKMGLRQVEQYRTNN